MQNILVCGLLNIETTLAINAFPIDYVPVHYPFYGIQSAVSGVGVNIALAMHRLGNKVSLLSLVGQDELAELVRSNLQGKGLSTEGVLSVGGQTAQSVILYDAEGRRQIHVDLKNLQELTFPEDIGIPALKACDIAVLCNINYARNLLPAAKWLGKTIATDVHVLADIHDDYNRDFITATDILFLSNEAIAGNEQEFTQRLVEHYSNLKIVVVGLGAHGALLWQAGDFTHQPAFQTRPTVNTIGAGDALFSAFVHFYAKGDSADAALRKAQFFASWKIGGATAVDDLLTESELLAKIPTD